LSPASKPSRIWSNTLTKPSAYTCEHHQQQQQRQQSEMLQEGLSGCPAQSSWPALCISQVVQYACEAKVASRHTTHQH
jgi:hypothetical protein